MFNFFIFDLDGTLIDTNEIIISTFKHVLKKELDYELEHHEMMKIFGQPLSKQMAYFSPENAEFLCQEYRKFYHVHSLKMTKLFPGVFETVQQLRQLEKPIGVVTNKFRKPAMHAIRALELEPFINFIIAGDEIKNPKPAPDAVIKCMEVMDAVPEETLMIGDSPLDMQAAKGAGIQNALVKWSIFEDEKFVHHSPDFFIENMSEILKL